MTLWVVKVSFNLVGFFFYSQLSWNERCMRHPLMLQQSKVVRIGLIFLCSMRGEGGYRKNRRGVFPALSTGFSSGLCGLPHVRCYFFLELSHTTKIYDPSPIEAKSRPWSGKSSIQSNSDTIKCIVILKLNWKPRVVWPFLLLLVLLALQNSQAVRVLGMPDFFSSAARPAFLLVFSRRSVHTCAQNLNFEKCHFFQASNSAFSLLQLESLLTLEK